LLADGHTVTVVDNFITGRPQNLAHHHDNPNLTIVRADIVDGVDIETDWIFHLASPASPVGYMRYPFETHLTNSVGTYNLLQLAERNHARFLFTSTSEAYGNPEVHPQPETYFGYVNPVGPRSCYDESKRFGESITMEYVRQLGLDARIVRIFNTYGPRNDPNDGRVIPNFISAARQGAPLTVYGDGSQTRSLCFVSDLVRGLRVVMEEPGLAGEVFNLGNPDERTILTLAEIVIAECDSRSEIHYLPARQDDPERRCPDITKIKARLGWCPVTSLEEGLRTTIQYFNAFEALPV